MRQRSRAKDQDEAEITGYRIRMTGDYGLEDKDEAEITG